MTFTRLKITGAALITNDVFRDQRGAFEAAWETADLEKEGIVFKPESACHSYNTKAGTLRGMHYQVMPYGQAKLVSCSSGAVYDVMVDLRPESPTYLLWDAVELSAASGKSIYIPAGCAHGFLTLQDNTIVTYLIEGAYNPQAAGAVRWNDNAIGIEWPAVQGELVLSERDKNVPDLKR
jgi:dTDP-4-dehydrorhamnose 3,5-epimerase